MADEADDSSTAFIRQRRDLFVVSAGLWLVQAAGIRAEKLAFLGMEFDLDNPDVLLKALWLLWLYWLVRYYQAFRDLTARPIRDTYVAFFNRSLMRAATRRSVEATRTIIDENSQYVGASLAERVNYGWSLKNGTAVFDWAPRLLAADGSIVEGAMQQTALPTRMVMLARVVAVVDMTLNSARFTEYIFPFLFSMVPVIYYVSRAFP